MKKIVIGSLEKKILKLALRLKGSVSTKECRLNIPQVQETYERAKEAAQMRGYSSVMSMPVTRTLSRMEDKGLFTSPSSKPFRKRARVYYLTKLGKREAKK